MFLLQWFKRRARKREEFLADQATIATLNNAILQQVNDVQAETIKAHAAYIAILEDKLEHRTRTSLWLGVFARKVFDEFDGSKTARMYIDANFEAFQLPLSATATVMADIEAQLPKTTIH